jgi:hypothetical protein
MCQILITFNHQASNFVNRIHLYLYFEKKKTLILSIVWHCPADGNCLQQVCENNRRFIPDLRQICGETKLENLKVKTSILGMSIQIFKSIFFGGGGEIA